VFSQTATCGGTICPSGTQCRVNSQKQMQCL
jgi:hypothetical protein